MRPALRPLLLSLALFFFTAFIVTAQNWKLVPKSGTLWLETENSYRQKLYDQALYTKAEVIGSDSVFSSPDLFYSIGTTYAKGKGLFADTLYKSSANVWRFYQNGLPYTIDLAAEPGSPSVSGLRPVLKTYKQLHGSLFDSVKVYRLSANQQITVSKNYGLISFGSFKLSSRQQIDQSYRNYYDWSRYQEVVYMQETSSPTGGYQEATFVSPGRPYEARGYLFFPHKDSVIKKENSMQRVHDTMYVVNRLDSFALSFMNARINQHNWDTGGLPSYNRGYFLLDSLGSIWPHVKFFRQRLELYIFTGQRIYAPDVDAGRFYLQLSLREGFSGGFGNASWSRRVVYTLDTLGNATGTRPILVSLDQNQTGSPISIYPNPATDQVHVAVSKPTSLEVINALGVTIRRLELTESTTIEQLQTGFYLFKLTQDGQSQVKRVVVR